MDPEESLDRALADLAIIESAYEQEIHIGSLDDDEDCQHQEQIAFPLRFTLQLYDTPSSSASASAENDEPAAALITLELTRGYPKETGVQIASYRAFSPKHKSRLDATVSAIRTTSLECLQDEMEGGMTCCATAFDVWNDYHNTNHQNDNHQIPNNSSNDDAAIINRADQDVLLQEQSGAHITCTKQYTWITGEPLIDKKSAFQAHVCQVFSEREVKESLQQLMNDNPKLHKATHNMFAYRLTEATNDGRIVLKHDNDDDGEDAAGARLAHLLEMRKEDCIFVVVSRWYGGIKLGPKRFAHINNVARELLQECHDKNLLKRTRPTPND